MANIELCTGEVRGYDTLDVRLALSDRISRFVPEISVGVNNLTDVRGVAYHLNVPAPTQQVFDFYHFVPPRTVVFFIAFQAPKTARRFQSRVASSPAIGCTLKPPSQNHSAWPRRG